MTAEELGFVNWIMGGGAAAVIWFFARRLIATLDKVADKVVEHGEEIGRHDVRINNMERELFK